MFSIGRNKILNPLEILCIPHTLILYLQILIMQISTQTDNHKYRKSVATKKSTLSCLIVEGVEQNVTEGKLSTFLKMRGLFLGQSLIVIK